MNRYYNFEECFNFLKNDYRYFLILCDQKKITQAAEVIGIQQAALSKSLKRLETSLGGDLFVRLKTGLKITPLGQNLKKQLLDLINNWNANLVQQRESVESIIGHFKIGSHQIIAQSILSGTLAHIYTQYPDIGIDLTFTKSSEIAQKVINFDLDLGLVVEPISHPNLIIKDIAKDYVAAWSTNETSISEKKLFFNSEMLNVKKILKKFKENKIVEISNYELLSSISIATKGIAILPYTIAKNHKSFKRISNKFFEVSISLIYRFDHPKSKAFQLITKLLSKKIK